MPLRVNSGLVVTRTIETIEFWGGDLALDFANTVEGTRPHRSPARLRGPRDLDATGRRAARERAAGGRLATARELRDAIYGVFNAVAAGDEASRAAP
jgi:predicted RNA-binding Zn ribbon-like protein